MRQSRRPSIKHLAFIAKLMDSQFRIPGTHIRFGLDPLIGLIPGFGDFAGFVVSACLLGMLAQNGASGFVLARMALNIVLDSVIGTIPILGDLFDLMFKANQRNLKLLEEHYVEGKHQGGAWKVIVPLLLILLLVVAGLVWTGIS
jgi:NADH:ubiquinone oxidoreductase subunit 5 (subunit L)/multisubunit Na+/H+ antiporter MnhA subunit